MDVDQLGAALVEQLVDRGLVRDVADLYDLDVGALTGLERMGKKSADNVVRAIDASRARTLDRLLTGLGIEHVGQVAARQLAEAAGDISTLLGWSAEEAERATDAIAGFGPKMVASVVAFLFDEHKRPLLDKLAQRDVSRPQPVAKVASTGPLVGKTFCVTGVLTRKRDDVHAVIRAAGGQVHDKIKTGTTFLVAGEKVGKSKLDAAKKKKTRVIDEAALDRMLAGDAIDG